MTHQVEIVRTAPTAAAVTRFHVDTEELPAIGDRISHALAGVMDRLIETGAAPDGPAIAAYTPAPDGFDVATGFRVAAATAVPPGTERLELGGVDVAHTTHIGAYSELPTAYDDLQHEAGARGLSVVADGPMWEEYWSPPGTPQAETRTEVFWPVAANAEPGA